MQRQYLQRNLTEERFQSNIGDPAVLKGEVPEQRFAPTEVDMSGTIGLAQDALQTYKVIKRKDELAADDARTATQKQNNDRKNTILNDFAIEDNKISLAVLQGMDPTEAAIARVKLKQQYAQIAPQEITMADLDKQANANLGVDIGATVFKNKMDRQNEAVKAYDAANRKSDENVMTTYYSEIKDSVPAEMWSSFNINLQKDSIRIDEALRSKRIDMQLHPEKYTPQSPTTPQSVQLQQAAEQQANTMTDMAILEAQKNIWDDGVVTEVEMQNFTSQLASWYATNYGVNYNQSLAASRNYVNKMYGPAVRQYQAQVKANAERMKAVDTMTDHQMKQLGNLITAQQIYGQSLGGLTNPAVDIVMQGNTGNLLRTAMMTDPTVFKQLMGTDVKAVLASNGVDVKSDHPVEHGRQAADFINLTQNIPLMSNLPQEGIDNYQKMAAIINQSALDNFVEMSNLSDRDLIGYPTGKVLRASFNDINVPSKVEREAIINNEPDKIETAINPTKVYNNDIIGREAKRQLQKEANGTFAFNTQEDKEAAQDLLRVTDQLKASMEVYDIVNNQGRRDWLRYDNDQNKFYGVYGSDASGLTVAKFRAQVENINKIVQDPLKSYTRDGVKVEDGKEIAERIVENYGIIQMPEKESMKLGEASVMTDEGYTSKTTRKAVEAYDKWSEVATDISDAVRSDQVDLDVVDTGVKALEAAKATAEVPFTFMEGVAEEAGASLAEGIAEPRKGPYEVARRNQATVDAMVEQYWERQKENIEDTVKEVIKEALTNPDTPMGKLGQAIANDVNRVKEVGFKQYFKEALKQAINPLIPSAGAAELPRDPFYETILSDEEVKKPKKKNKKEERKDPFAEGMIGPEDE